jgi:hypothetical protein
LRSSTRQPWVFVMLHLWFAMLQTFFPMLQSWFHGVATTIWNFQSIFGVLQHGLFYVSTISWSFFTNNFLWCFTTNVPCNSLIVLLQAVNLDVLSAQSWCFKCSILMFQVFISDVAFNLNVASAQSWCCKCSILMLQVFTFDVAFNINVASVRSKILQVFICVMSHLLFCNNVMGSACVAKRRAAKHTHGPSRGRGPHHVGGPITSLAYKKKRRPHPSNHQIAFIQWLCACPMLATRSDVRALAAPLDSKSWLFFFPPCFAKIVFLL